MALPESYLVTTKNLKSVIEAVTKAQAPTKFTLAFLKNLGFKSTNDRLYLKLFKDLGLLDGSGVPNKTYFEFIDRTQTSKILGKQIMEAYSDLYSLNKEAHKMTKTEVKNKFRTLTQGAKSDNVLDLMAKTFKALADNADFNVASLVPSDNDESNFEYESDQDLDERRQQIGEIVNKNITTEMHYNIQIHLPETKDIAVYDAIFKSLKEHLL
ncbi:DUF5343 domain-containing protein [Winogradskyella ouciana]|uniref:DUF5343 domain-containing protein n=1 Tax=Winogradskyella ouciana TaxID=2608631 RepID=A0A7K1GCB7_9FLAO|nr:DUF5343 domain-containing protein [Winogradskyella ouciana]MTE26048.1 hypothetical protein [Winogradskyella ouciana]